MSSLKTYAKWLLVLVITATVIGSASALFLWSLEQVTLLRHSQGWLLFLLPIAGLAMGWYYQHLAKDAAQGNQIIISDVANHSEKIPHKLAPSILLSTLITHLFGGSAGREGTAIQMGAGLASICSTWFTNTGKGRNLLILCGIAAGFGAVFGTPLAGVIFAREFLRKRILSRSLLPCLITALLATLCCHLWGAEHTVYPEIDFNIQTLLSFPLILKILLFAVCIALMSRWFIWISAQITFTLSSRIKYAPWRLALGGALVIGFFYLSGTSDYLGLGVIPQNPDSLTLPRFLLPETHAPASAWMWKIAFTVITLAAGFKGGEVTPLLFIGAAFGNSLAWFLGAPVDLFAALGMIALFAAVTKTPYASIIMGAELLGWHLLAPLACSIFVAYRLSGKHSIYPHPSELCKKQNE